MKTSLALSFAVILLAPAISPCQAVDQRLEIDRKGATIVLEPYAPNILRVTLSLQRDNALSKPGYGFVGASKAALESLVRTLAQELGPKHISVNTVSAGVPRAGQFQPNG